MMPCRKKTSTSRAALKRFQYEAMKLRIYSLKRTLFQGEAELLNCETLSGEITVLDNHKPLITVLRAGTIKILDKNKKEHYIPVSSGFMEIRSGSEGMLIVEEAET